jgi:phosphatidylglycerol---prolipoprotein diacylglyceryl transferase
MSQTWLHDIDPIAIPLPFWPHGIHWYGLMYVVSFLVAWWLGARRIRQGRLPGVDENAWGDLMFYGMLGVVLGGRLGYVLFYGFGELLRDPLMVLRINEGGMSFHGGLIGVVIAKTWWSWKHRIHPFDTLDFVAPLVAPGLFFVRLGNYIGGELWGKPTGGDGGVVFPGALPAEYAHFDMASLRVLHESGALDAYARHPSQLYEAALEGIVVFVVLFWFSRKPRRRYSISGLFALMYGVFRFAVEFVREPDAHIGYLAWGWLTMGQVLTLPLVALGLALLWLSRRAPTPQPQAIVTEPEASR